MATALERLKAAQAELDAAKAAAATEIAASKNGTIVEIIEHMKENEITLADLLNHNKIAASKYNNGKETWSGKGKQPVWLSKAIAGGKKLEDFVTKKPTPTAE